MVTVSITVEGSPEELIPVLQHIADISIEKPTPQAPEISLAWTEKDIAVVWRDITLDCQYVLKEIAKHEDISTQSLIDMLGISTNQLGGRLSSLGRQLKNSGLDRLPYPLRWTAFGYRMSTIWRETIAKIEGE